MSVNLDEVSVEKLKCFLQSQLKGFVFSYRFLHARAYSALVDQQGSPRGYRGLDYYPNGIAQERVHSHYSLSLSLADGLSHDAHGFIAPYENIYLHAGRGFL